eukprot:2799078-Prymnesium_polylepis.1
MECLTAKYTSGNGAVHVQAHTGAQYESGTGKLICIPPAAAPCRLLTSALESSMHRLWQRLKPRDRVDPHPLAPRRAGALHARGEHLRRVHRLPPAVKAMAQVDVQARHARRAHDRVRVCVVTKRTGR